MYSVKQSVYAYYHFSINKILYALSSTKCLAYLASNNLHSFFPKLIFYTLQHRINAMDYSLLSTNNIHCM